MLYQNTPQISASKVPGVIFASGVTTPLVPLNNSQTVSFLIASGEGTAGNSTIIRLWPHPDILLRRFRRQCSPPRKQEGNTRVY